MKSERKETFLAKEHQFSSESTWVADQRTPAGYIPLCDSSATERPRSVALKILVLAQDLADANIQRRIVMLCAGGALVTVAGFRRVPQSVENVAGCRTLDFGQTSNARFFQRIIAVVQKLISLRRYKALFADADVIIARNLDMLLIATCGRSLCKPLPVLVYEVLDIHPLMLNNGPVGLVLRWLERQLSRRAAGITTSSPGFVSHYFQSIARLKIPIRLVENKVLHINEEVAPCEIPPPRTPGPPWVIGWFGKLRCTRSLPLLIELTKQSEGAVQVVIRGKPLRHLFGDFEKTVRDLPGVKFLGPYRNPQDLQNIYRDVHFTWAIDMCEEGLNSSWLLPNRVYEGGLYAAVPMALASVETGRFLKQLGVGVLLTDPLACSLRDFFATLTPQKYHDLETAVLSLPRATWLCGRNESAALVNWLGSVGKPQAPFD